MNQTNELPFGRAMFPDDKRGAAWLNKTAGDALDALRDHTDDADLKDMLDQILDGKRPLRDLATQPAFEKMAVTGMDAYRDAMKNMTPEQRKAMAEEASRQGVAAGIVAPDEEIPLLP